MLAELVTGDTLTTAWARALERLAARGGEAFDLLVVIEHPDPSGADPRVVRRLDDLLAGEQAASVRTVSNTIFPEQLARTSHDRQTLYQRYRAVLPRLKRAERRNRRGLYFERLINFPLQPNPTCANQLEDTIQRLRDELARGNALAHAYELQVFAPGKDRRPMGFPCMSSLSFHVEEGGLRLCATYRNQYYVSRALGNFVGLANLQRFVASEAGMEPGVLSVHAFHAQLDPSIGKRNVATLVRECQSLIAAQMLATSAVSGGMSGKEVGYDA